MKRTSIFVMVAILVAGCGSTPSSQPPDQSQAAGHSQAQGPSQAPSSAGGGSGGSALVSAANAVTDWCTMMPADLAAQLVPGASAPQSQLFVPLKCTVSNGVSVLEITYQGYVVAEIDPSAASISGIAENAWLAVGYPVDDSYLTVILSSGDPGATLYVEVAGHDGVDHADDAVAVAKAVLAQLH